MDNPIQIVNLTAEILLEASALSAPKAIPLATLLQKLHAAGVSEEAREECITSGTRRGALKIVAGDDRAPHIYIDMPGIRQRRAMSGRN